MKSRSTESSREKRILAVFGRDIDCDGCQVYLYNTLSNMDLSGFRVDFYTPGKVLSQEFAMKLEKVGKGHVFATGICVPAQKYETIIFAILRDLRKLIRENHYDIIHVKAGTLIFQSCAILAGKLYGVPTRFAHSSNTFSMPKGKRGYYYRLARKLLVKNATHMFACSQQAADSMFGRQSNRAEVLPNVIDVRKYRFHEEVRDEFREKLKANDALVIGHVGRFAKQKNHAFLVNVFREILQIEPSARLLLIGDGPRMERIEQAARELGIRDKVIFTGITDEVEKYMCAMDVFVLPSLYEGLGIVNIEAQSSGLPCVVSDFCPPEAKVSDLLEFMPLSEGERAWAERIVAAAKKATPQSRAEAWNAVMASGYDASTVKNIYKLYAK